MSDLSYALEVVPETALQFTLTRNDVSVNGTDPKSDGTARCVMTLKHTGKTSDHIAFKVKTTQPRRYLVRPNQGIVAPGTTENVTILLVEKDKQMLLQSFDRLGQSALDHSKDKFLVQSCAVKQELADAYSSKKKEMAQIAAAGDNNAQEMSKFTKEISEELTNMWNVANGSDETPIYNKKLQVRHVVAPGPEGSAPTSTSRSGGGRGTEKTPLDSMTPEQMFAEITSLRRKYDELVTFSVNLTAERDILNNTLEQTKRDLNREMARAKDNRAEAALAGQAIGAGGGNGKSSAGLSILYFFFVAVLFFLIGVKGSQMDAIVFLYDVPVLGDVLRAELWTKLLKI